MAVVIGSPARGNVLWGREILSWANLQEASLKPLWVSMIRSGGVGWRTRMLDVGCGTGGALSVGRGLDAAVAGIDADDERVRFAQHRIRFGDIRVGDLESLPFVDDCCTFVMSTDLVWAPRSGERLLGEMCRVCAPNGRVAVAVWGDPDRCDQSAVFEALGTPEPFRYRSDPALTHLVEEGCGRVQQLSDATATFDYPSVDAAWFAQRQTGWGKRAIADLGLAEARTAFLGAIRRFTRDDGRVRLRNEFRYAILTKR